MANQASFGRWLSAHRHLLDLTQDELACQVGCSVVTIRKLESDARRPSKPIAERLAGVLELRADERTLFLQIARGLASADRLPPPIPGGAAGPALPTPTPPALPSGTVTFLFTDIEGSTQLWEQHPQAMQPALARHDMIMRQAIAAAAGVVYKVIGDAFQAAFPTAPAACAAALAAQRALAGEAWGVIGAVPVRMALHTCAAVPEDGDYRTGALNRLGRLLGVVHGEQIVLSRSTADLARDTLPPDVTLRDLGERQLRDLRPEPIFQLVAPDLPSDFPALKTLDRPRHNLPAQPNVLIGRAIEAAAVRERLLQDNMRLLTLTGPGGTGKTRLAMQATFELLDDFTDGVWFVNLAPISDSSLVAGTVAQTLGVRESSGRPLLDQLKDYLREKQLLLLLDNFEQVVAAAPLVGELLAAAPALKVLVTSRESLHLSGEHEYAVPPLALPPTDDGRRTIDDQSRGLAVGGQSSVVGQYAAVQLFLARAQAVKADFAVTDTSAPAIAAICRRLDGLPLAIELAAARVKLLPPQALLTRLDQRLKLLTGGARDLPARQQTIRATIEWSYHLLDAEEQSLFAWLGVFVGGWTLEAAAAICNATGDLPIELLDGLAALLDQSLLRQEMGTDGEPRFSMLETIREYALEQLNLREEATSIRQRHADYFLDLAEQAQQASQGQIAWYHRRETEHDNLRAALQWFLAQHQAARALQLSGALWWFWLTRGHLNEGRQWLTKALATTIPVSSIARLKALLGAGSIALDQRDFTAAMALFEQGLTIARAVQDHEKVATLLYTLGEAARLQGDLQNAAARFEESIVTARGVENKVEVAASLVSLGTIAHAEGDHARAAILLEESLTLHRELGDVIYTAWCLATLGRVATDQGDWNLAGSRLIESLSLFHKLIQRNGIAYVLEGFAGLASAQGQTSRAACLFGAAEALREAIHTPLSAFDRPEYERKVATVRAQMDEAAFAAASTAGRGMTLEQAIAYALDGSA